MGIRIHKALGFALLDFKGKEDIRLKDSRALADMEWRIEPEKIVTFLSWC